LVPAGRASGQNFSCKIKVLPQQGSQQH